VSALGVVLGSRPTFAAQAPLDDAARCALADLVLIGRVAGIDTVWAADPEGGLERRVQIVVQSQWKGATARWVEVTLPGGTDGRWTHSVEDVPDLTTADRWGLFLMRTPRGLEVVGGGTGAIAIASSDGWAAGVPASQFAARAAVCRGP
jgi:hypothetical protein